MIPAAGVVLQPGTPGTGAVVREGQTLEQITGIAHGKYYEAASRGKLFAAADQGAGVAPGTTLSTTAALVLYNPQGSGRRLAVKKVRVAYFSGTLGSGDLYHCVNTTTTQAAPSGGTVLANTCLDAGGAGIGSVGVARVGATVVQPVIVGPICALDPELATSVVGLRQVTEDLNGEIVLEPGTSYQIQAVAAAGTSPKITLSVTWEEVPLPA